MEAEQDAGIGGRHSSALQIEARRRMDVEHRTDSSLQDRGREDVAIVQYDEIFSQAPLRISTNGCDSPLFSALMNAAGDR